MMLNIELNEELGIRIWSFPMRYQPTDRPDRTFVGEKWSRYELRSLQLILQATGGVVSGEPDFFRHAFGSSVEEFRDLLLRPHHYIFNRDWFEIGPGRAEFEAFMKEFRSFSEPQRFELRELLSSVSPRHFHTLPNETTDHQLRSVLGYYEPPPRDIEREMWDSPIKRSVGVGLGPEEIVEDAGLLEAV
jgi:hypothetical protein